MLKKIKGVHTHTCIKTYLTNIVCRVLLLFRVQFKYPVVQGQTDLLVGPRYSWALGQWPAVPVGESFPADVVLSEAVSV